MSTKEVHSMLVLPIVLVLLEGICLSCGEISAQPTLLQSQHHCQSLYIQWMKYCPCLPQSTLHTTTLPIKWRGGRVNAGDYKSVYIHFTFNVSFGQHCYYYCCYLFFVYYCCYFYYHYHFSSTTNNATPHLPNEEGEESFPPQPGHLHTQAFSSNSTLHSSKEEEAGKMIMISLLTMLHS